MYRALIRLLLFLLSLLMPQSLLRKSLQPISIYKRFLTMSNNKFVHDHSFNPTQLEINTNSLLSNIYDPSNIINYPYKRNVFAVYVTGGGVKTMEYLLTIPGASNSIMETSVPYSRSALSNFLQLSTIDSTSLGGCNEETAVAMARQAYKRALNLFLEDTQDLRLLSNTNVFGVSCTAALVSTGIKKGKHRTFVSLYNADGVKAMYYYDLEKGLRTRVQEDALCSQIILHAVAKQCNMNINSSSASASASINYGQTKIDTLPIDADGIVATDQSDSCPQETLMVRNYAVGDMIDNLYAGNLTHALFVPYISETESASVPASVLSIADSSSDVSYTFRAYEEAKVPSGSFVYPGSFNPLHSGHCELVAAAMRNISTVVSDEPSGMPSGAPSALVVFEIAAINADKPSLSKEILRARIAQFHPTHPIGQAIIASGISNHAVCITSKPYFVDKSEFFPRCRFVIGVDTAVRLIDSKYYTDKSITSESSSSTMDTQQNSVLNMITALNKISFNGCSFIVGGRVKQGITTQSSDRNAFETWSDLQQSSSIGQNLPHSIMSMFTSLSEAQFRADISSTELRKAATATAAKVKE